MLLTPNSEQCFIHHSVNYISRASSYGGGSTFLEESSDCGVSGADGPTGQHGLLVLVGEGVQEGGGSLLFLEESSERGICGADTGLLILVGVGVAV